MANTHNAHSDLIHLFIDGEATETERNILFGALKDSPELQEEFSSAMQLKQAFASDIMKLQPPSYLESKIAERAGLIVAASSTVATAPVVVNSLSNSITSALSTAAPVAATGISKGLMTLLIGTTVGVLSTIGIIQYTKETPKTATQIVAPAIAQGSVNQAQPAPAALIPQSSNADINSSASTFAAKGSQASAKLPAVARLHSAAPLANIQFSKANLNEQASSIAKSDEKVNTVPANIIPPQAEKVENVNTNTPNGHATIETIAAAPAMPPIASAEPIVPVVKNVGWTRANRNPINNASEEYFNEPDWMAHFSTSFRLMGVSKLYQGHDDVASAPSWNNMSLSVKYEVDPFRAFALEVGQETFPVFLSDGKGSFNAHQSIIWGGMSYTISNPLWKFLGIYPEARALLGVSTAGPIAKISAGLVFQPVERISFALDPEYTALFIRQNGTPSAGSKLGLTYSLIYHF